MESPTSPPNTPDSQIAQNSCAEFEEIAEICENYESIRVTQTHSYTDDTPQWRRKPFFANDIAAAIATTSIQKIRKIHKINVRILRIFPVFSGNWKLATGNPS